MAEETHSFDSSETALSSDLLIIREAKLSSLPIQQPLYLYRLFKLVKRPAGQVDNSHQQPADILCILFSSVMNPDPVTQDALIPLRLPYLRHAPDLL